MKILIYIVFQNIEGDWKCQYHSKHLTNPKMWKQCKHNFFKPPLDYILVFLLNQPHTFQYIGDVVYPSLLFHCQAVRSLLIWKHVPKRVLVSGTTFFFDKVHHEKKGIKRETTAKLTSAGFGKLSCTNSKSIPLAEEDSYTIAGERRRERVWGAWSVNISQLWRASREGKLLHHCDEKKKKEKIDL